MVRRLTPWQVALAGVLALSALPGTARAACGMGNQCCIVDLVSASTNPATAGALLEVTCAAHDPNGVITRFTLSSSAGTFVGSNSSSLQISAIPQAQSARATVQWRAPSVVGSVTLTCIAWDNGGLLGTPTQSAPLSTLVAVTATATPPVIDSIEASSNEVLPGATVQFVATAHSSDQRPLSYAWSVGGIAVGANSPTLDWIAPAVAGSYSVALVVSDDVGQSAQASALVVVVPKQGAGALVAIVKAPRRLAVDGSGRLFVVDARAGRLWLLTARGEVRGRAPLLDRIAAVAAGADQLFVVTEGGRLLVLDPTAGTVRGEIALVDGPAVTPDGLAFAVDAGLLLIAEREANRVRAVRLNGSTAYVVSAANGAPLMRPVDVAVEATGQRFWVALREKSASGQLHCFALNGAPVRSLLLASDLSAVSRLGGLTVDTAGALYLADAFQGRVQIVNALGVGLGQLGTFGTRVGTLNVPTGLAWLGNGDLIVASLNSGRLERYGVGAPLPICAGDTDCDGISDAVEIAHGLDPTLPTDALADVDHDGLSALEEIAHGTSPTNPDTDGDGYLDGIEVAAGFDPLNVSDHRPVLLAGPAQQSNPGLVQFSSTLQSDRPCQVSWVQSSGPIVALRGAQTLSPSFVGRVAGSYRFRGIAACQGAISAPAEVQATINNVAPLVDVGRPVVASIGQRFVLDGALSSDPNGDALRLGWDQILGSPLLSADTADPVELQAAQPGLLRFELTGADSKYAHSSASADVVVVNPTSELPATTVVTPVVGGAYKPLQLAASVDPLLKPMTTYVWEQLAGPAVSCNNAGSATPSFVPSGPGHYAFAFSVSDGVLETPPQRVDVYVAEADGLLPEAVAPATLEATVGEPIVLDGSDSCAAHTGAALDYSWRQLAGPSAGLTDAASARATVVPFAPGRQIFELVVSEGAVQGIPAEVVVVARSGRCTLPAAHVAAVATSTVFDPVTLIGSAEGNCGLPVGFRWTQVAGPWIALDDPTSATPRFVPRLRGAYVFELEVDDGVARSTAVRVSVQVQPRGGTP